MNYKFHDELKKLSDKYPLTSSERENLKILLKEKGQILPILTWNGYIVDGHNRLEILNELGVEPKFKDVAFDSLGDAKMFIIENYLGQRNLNDGQKWELAQDKKEILHRKGKERRKATLKRGDESPDLSTIDKTESHNTRDEIAKDLGWSTGKVAMADKVWKEAEPEVKESIKSGETSINQAYQGLKKAHVSNNSGNNEWYTPLNYIESAKKVMGNIDLDPASSDNVNNKIKANSYYTKENSGLTKKWIGNIWLNPPYESGLVDKFIDKLEEKTYNQAIVLVNNATETKWGNKILKLSDCVCFHKSRIRFISTDGKEKNSPLQGQMIIYIGKNKHNFINEFKEYGICLSVEK